MLGLGGEDDQEQTRTVKAVKSWLEKTSNWLLIFDNADDPGLVEEFTPENPRGHVILTSRGQVFDNLGITQPIELEKLSSSEAKKLLLTRTGRGNLEGDEDRAVEQLALELDYLPLALEQAGAYILRKRSSFADYITGYHARGVGLLEEARPVVGKYQKSVATTWSLNFEQVEEVSAAAADLMRVSSFLDPEQIPFELITDGAQELGPAISAALTEVARNPLALDELLEPLNHYSLIRRSLNRTYGVHRLVQSVVRASMSEGLQREWLERALKAINRAFPLEVGHTNWARCERLFQHALTCIEISGESSSESAELGDLLIKVGGYLLSTSRYDKAYACYLGAQAQYQHFGNLEGVVTALKGAGDVSRLRDDYDRAERHYEEALKVFVSFATLAAEEQAVGEQREETASIKPFQRLRLYHPNCWHSLGDHEALPLTAGEFDPGEKAYDISGQARDRTTLYAIEYECTEVDTTFSEEEVENIVDVREVTITSLVADIWLGLGHLYLSRDSYDRAAACARLAHQIYADLGESFGVLHAQQLLRGLGATIGDMKMVEGGVAFQQSELEAAHEKNDSRAVLLALLGLAGAYADAAEYGLARDSYNAALELALLANDRVSEATACAGLAWLDWATAAYDDAAKRLDLALRLYREINNREAEARLLLDTGYFELKRGRWESAARNYDAAHHLFSSLQVQSGQVEAMRGKGLSALYSLHYAEAAEYATNAAKLAREINVPSLEAASLLDLALVCGGQGDYGRAREICRQALQIFQQIGSRQDEAHTYLALGDLALGEGALEEAISFYQRAAEMFSELRRPAEALDSKFGVLSVHQRRKDTATALDMAEETLRLSQRLALHEAEIRALIEMGDAYSSAGYHQRAVKVLENVIRIDPENAEALGELGWVLFAAGECERSIEYSRRAFNIDQTQTWVLRNLGNAYLALGRPDEAEENYRQAISLRRAGENFKETIEVVKELLRRRPELPRGDEILQLLEIDTPQPNAENDLSEPQS